MGMRILLLSGGTIVIVVIEVAECFCVDLLMMIIIMTVMAIGLRLVLMWACSRSTTSNVCAHLIVVVVSNRIMIEITNIVLWQY